MQVFSITSFFQLELRYLLNLGAKNEKKLVESAVVGSGAVVSKDVDPYAIVAGNPARKIGERPKDLVYECDYQPWLL